MARQIDCSATGLADLPHAQPNQPTDQ